MATRDNLVLPFIHLNGDRAETLLDNLENVYLALNEAAAMLRQATPNARNYYPEPGRYELAVQQHERRMKAIRDLQDELEAECKGINERK